MNEERPKPLELKGDFKTANIFLTGTTGVLGGYLLKELLESTDSNIFCLVRGQDKEHGRKRLLHFLQVYDPEGTLVNQFNLRVTPILGDVSERHFNLPEDEYVSLCKGIDVIIHAAASTNLFTTLRKIAPINLDGTRNVIDFALQTRQKYLTYISTYTVMGDKTFDASVVFRETDLDIGQGFKYLAYQQSKFLAEKEVIQATKLGLRWNIVRPGQVFGDSRTGLYPQGITSVGGLFYDIFKTITDTRIAFYSKTHFDVVPVDYVAKGIVHLALRRKRAYETFHLTNPDIKSYFEVVQLLKSFGYPIEIVPIPEYRQMLLDKSLRLNGEEYKSATTMAFRYWFRFSQFDFTESAITDCTRTREVLEPAGIPCHPIDGRLIKTYFDRGIAQNYFSAPGPLELRTEIKKRVSSATANEWAFE